MNRKWRIFFYFCEWLWCIWLVVAGYGLIQDKPQWYNYASFYIAILLLIYISFVIWWNLKPRPPKELNYVIEQGKDGSWWVSLNEYQEAGPYSTRPEATQWIIDKTQEEMRK